MSAPQLPITIRPEAAGDEATIHTLTETAFAPMPFSGGTEQHVIDALRKDGDLTLSLVAEDAHLNSGRIVGHIAFSPVTIADGAQGWFGLGPVSVWPELQKSGPQLTYAGGPPEFFQVLLLDGDMPSGAVAYAPGFAASA